MSESAQVTPPNSDIPVLRFPAITLTAWYRIAEIAAYRGLLPATKFRLARFLNMQRLDTATGRVEGLYGADQVDGGVALSERYAYVAGVGKDRFWDDLKGLFRCGFAERVVAPAPGRRAVYALCLRADAIPGDLPEDLARELRLWDLPEVEEPDEDAAYGRLTARQAPTAPSMPAPVENGDPRQLAVDMAASPRWEHPVGSTAAAVAQGIWREWQRADREHREADSWYGWEPVEAPAPKPEPAKDFRCTAVADRDRAAEIDARMAQLTNKMAKRLPLTRGVSSLGGLFPTGSRGLGPANGMEKPKTTPSAATREEFGWGFGDDLAAVATRIQRRVWRLWRAQLGSSVVFLPQPTPEELSRSVTGSAWSDLHRTIMIALRRGGTESQLVELLSENVVQRDRWGRVTSRATNLGRLAGWRLWRFINARPNAPHYATRRQAPVPRHVEQWDNTTFATAERARIMATPMGQHDDLNREAERREQERRREAARLAAEAERAAQAQRAAEIGERWGLDRWKAPAEPEGRRRWTAREPEHVHQEVIEERMRIESPLTKDDPTRAAALARARAEKRARRRKGR